MKCVPIKGIITPILTPMNADESVNLDELRRQIERLIAGGVHGIFPFGTNGEGYILSMEEKISVLEATIDQVKGRVPVYAGTGCVTPSPSAVRRSAWARTSCPSLPPSFAVASQQELYDHYCAVAAHVDTPIVLYNIPARTGNKLLPETVCRLAKDVDFSVLSGNDSLILPALKEGGVGGIAGCSNVYPMVLSSIYELFQEGKLDEAQAAQDSIASFRAVFKYGNPNTVVKTAAMLGYNVGKCRAPFNQLPQEGLEALEKVLQENKDKGMC